jgi:hypothetical protein
VTIFFEVPPVASSALLTTLHPLLKNMLQTIDHLETSYLEVPFSWSEKPRNCMGRDVDCIAFILMGSTDPLFPSQIQNNSDLAPCNFLAFPTMEMEL